jgi:hypothetical protein
MDRCLRQHVRRSNFINYLSGLVLSIFILYSFAPSYIHLNLNGLFTIHMRKAQFHQDLEENMLLGDMQLENKGIKKINEDALLVNYVLLLVQLKPSRLKVSQDQMVQEELQDTILI